MTEHCIMDLWFATFVARITLILQGETRNNTTISDLANPVILKFKGVSLFVIRSHKLQFKSYATKFQAVNNVN